jgi:hypothetical protein
VDRGTARLLIVVVLAVVGGLVLANGFDDDATSSAAATPTTTPSESVATSTPGSTPSDEPDPVQPQPPEEVLFMALNGTSVAGAGAAAQTEMEDAGYVAAEDADDAPVQGAEATSVLYRVGANDEETAQNEANAQRVAKKVFKGALVRQLSNDYDDIVPADATIVVVVGIDDAESLIS